MIVKLGDGSTDISYGAGTLENGEVVVGVMFKLNARPACQNHIGVQGEQRFDIRDFDSHIVSTNVESLVVLRDQLNSAIEQYEHLVAKERGRNV